MADFTTADKAKIKSDASEEKQLELTISAKAWDAQGEDAVRVNIIKDVGKMRRYAFWFMMVFPLFLLVLLPVQMHLYVSWFSPNGKMIEAMATPMTALISGTYLSITAIYGALLLGLFKNVLDYDKKEKETMADMPSPSSAADTLSGGG